MTTKKFTPIIKRGPRLTPGEINVTPPDDLGVEIPPSGIQKALPWVMGGGMLGMIAIMIFTGIRQLSPYMLMMPLMMVMATVGFMAGGGPGGKRVPEINADRKEYLRYLAGLRTRVTSSAAAQVTFFNYHAPHPEDLLSIIGTNRQWSRQVNADFYAATRIGLGAEPAVDRLLKPAVGGELAGPQGAPQPHLEPVSHMWVTKFLRTHGLIHDCPKLVAAADISDHRRRRRSGGCRGTADRDDLSPRGVPSAGPAADPGAHRQPGGPELGVAEVVAACPASVRHRRRGRNPAGVHPARRVERSDRAWPAHRRLGAERSVCRRHRSHRRQRPDSRWTAGPASPSSRSGNHRGSAYRIRVDADGTADDRLPNQTFRLVTSVADRMTPRAGHPRRAQAGGLVHHRHDHRQERARAEEGRHRVAPAGRRANGRGSDARAGGGCSPTPTAIGCGSRSATNSRPATSCTSTSRRVRSSVPVRTGCSSAQRVRVSPSSCAR